jgi:hypothetical protein
VSLAELELLAAAFAALPTAPQIARPVLRVLAEAYRLVTVKSVFEDFIVV